MDLVYLGKITGTHGVRGDVKVYPFVSDPQRFQELKKVYIADRVEPVEMEIKQCRFTGNFVILSFLGILDMDDAQNLKGCRIAVEESDIPSLPEGRYYVFDLIGCRVFDENENDLGELCDVISTSANDVYVVRRPEKNDLLIPVISSVIEKVDIRGRRIDVRLPEGLLSVYE